MVLIDPWSYWTLIQFNGLTDLIDLFMSSPPDFVTALAQDSAKCVYGGGHVCS